MIPFLNNVYVFINNQSKNNNALKYRVTLRRKGC